MASIAQERQARRARSWRTVRWTIQLSPLGALATAATFAGVMFVGSLLLHRNTSRVARVELQEQAAAALTQFVFVAPGAHTVALVGDFNDWSVSSTPLT